MVTQEYILWAVMLAILILSVVNVVVGLVTLFLYAWGITLVGLKVTIPFLIAWLPALYFSWGRFVEAA